MNLTYGKGFFPAKPVDADSLIVIDGGDVRFNVPDKSPAVIRQRIRGMIELLMQCPDKTEMPVAHEFVDGMYIRRLFIPKGTILAGKIHLKACINVLESGDISILTETGCGRIKPGHMAVSGVGIQKLGYAHEDTVFANIFRTDETSIEKIEAVIATDNYEALGSQKLEALCL